MSSEERADEPAATAGETGTLACAPGGPKATDTFARGADGTIAEDRALLARVANGDRAATALFVGRHKAALFRFAEASLRDRALAEDVLQETFLSAIRGASGYRGEGSARGWLFMIARRAALRIRPRELPLSEEEELSSLGVDAGWGAPDPEALLSGEQARAAVNRALDALPAEDREILVLRDAEGLTGPEAAEVLQISLAAMKSRLHRARLRMVAALRATSGEGPPYEETNDERA